MIDPFDSRVHFEIMRHIVDRGFASSADEIASLVGASREKVEAALRRLHEGHGLVLHPASHDVWIAHPFSLSPTAVWVDAGERGWWSGCLWCASGVVALTGTTGSIRARLGGEREDVALRFDNGRLASGDLLVHFSLPPGEAWTNVVHFCASVLPFRTARDVDDWCRRHRLPRGGVMPLATLEALARAWYGRHLAPDWRKWTVAEAQSIFEGAGLTDEFWRLPPAEGPF